MRNLGIRTLYVPNKIWDESPEDVIKILNEADIDLVVLAGFMHFISPKIINAYRNRMINIHPSLLPAYGGKGMWGHHVHEAVIAAGEKRSGVTVHFVTEEMDKGEIIMQQSVDVAADDTAATLEAKIHEVEYQLYPRAIVAVLGNMKPRKSIDQQWAETLKMPIPEQEQEQVQEQTPPPIPQQAAEEQIPPIPPVVPTPSAANTSGHPADNKLPEEPMPSNYLIWSILATVFCCLPAGIVAIIFSSQVSSRYYNGDLEGSRKASRMAEWCIIISFVLGVITASFYLPLLMLK
jgi:phosphoribosylglycinamide formyltransferase-1